MELRTVNGYDFYEVTSAMQKAIRRNQPDVAGYFALELFHSNFIDYLWKRLFIISAEDCYGLVTKEIEALYNAFMLVRRRAKKENAGRIFVSKAVLILCSARKCRDADHLQNLVYDRKMIDEEKVKQFLENVSKKDKIEVPEYTFDCHTKKGRMRGKTKKQFFKEEIKNLKPRQMGLFDKLVENL